MTIVDFKSKKDKNGDRMVEQLESYLALAKAGKIQTLVVSTVLESGSVQCSCTGGRLDALGALRVAENNILNSFEEMEPEEA